MGYLAITFGFGYSDLMDMEHAERVSWVDQANTYNEEQKKAMDKPRGKIR
jgi:hypothetical protein